MIKLNLLFKILLIKCYDYNKHLKLLGNYAPLELLYNWAIKISPPKYFYVLKIYYFASQYKINN